MQIFIRYNNFFHYALVYIFPFWDIHPFSTIIWFCMAPGYFVDKILPPIDGSCMEELLLLELGLVLLAAVEVFVELPPKYRIFNLIAPIILNATS